MLAPTLGWFREPSALERVDVPLVAMVGELDRVTPPAELDLLRAGPGLVEERRYEGVGHLDFMSELPPGVVPTDGLDHIRFLDELERDFVAALG